MFLCRFTPTGSGLGPSSGRTGSKGWSGLLRLHPFFILPDEVNVSASPCWPGAIASTKIDKYLI